MKKKIKKVQIEEKITEGRLNKNQKKFCDLYANHYGYMGNASASYIKAFNIDTDDEKVSISDVRYKAYEEMKKPEIIDEINRIYDKSYISDQDIDNQLGFLVRQFFDMDMKLKSIDMVNKLRGRYNTGKGALSRVLDDPDANVSKVSISIKKRGKDSK